MLKINNEYYLDSDPLNVILVRKVERKSRDGKVYEDTEQVGYYPTVPAAILGFFRIAVRDRVGTDEDLDGLRRSILRIERELKEIYKKTTKAMIT